MLFQKLILSSEFYIQVNTSTHWTWCTYFKNCTL